MNYKIIILSTAEDDIENLVFKARFLFFDKYFEIWINWLSL